MAILHEPGEIVDFTPADQARRPPAQRVVYRLRVPGVYDRVAWRRAIAARGGRRHGPQALLAALRQGVAALMDPGPSQDFLLGAIDEQIERLGGFTALAGSDDAEALAAAWQELVDGDQALGAVAAEVGRAHEPYAQMMGDNSVYLDIAGIEAARRFVVGWSGISGDPERDDKSLTEAALARIPETHFAAIAARVEELVRPSETESGNFGSPSRGPSNPTSSAAASPQRPTIR